MEVVVVPMKEDFLFDSTASTPYVSAPSSPKRSGDHPFNYYPCHYGSAPTSPARAAAIYASSLSMVPFHWEDAPGTPKSHDYDDDEFEFEFEFSGQLRKGVLPPEITAADELFDQGKIRPLKPPPRLYTPNSPRSPKMGLFSPRHRNSNKKDEESDPFAAAMVEATREMRGRRVPSPSSISSSSRSRKGSRSLSPMRGGNGDQRSLSSFIASPHDNINSTSAISAATKSKKWRLRDFLLFRSASEGRVTGNTSKDPLRKYTIMPSSSDSRNSSFRSVDSSTHSGGSSSMRHHRGGGNMSPHEKHYTSNRAATEELKKKTALPFGRHGLFGCLKYNPAVQSIARGIHGSSALNRRQ